ncbi:MAG: RNA-binding transcriptional accessory protein, partial [Psychrobacter alimentarius]
FVADPMNRVKPGDIVSVRVISIDEKRGRIGFSMKPEAEKPARTVTKAAEANSSYDDKATRPRSSRPAADKRPSSSKPRGSRQDSRQEGRQDKGSTNTRGKAAKNESTEVPSKMGTFGALLKEAGVTKTKK